MKTLPNYSLLLKIVILLIVGFTYLFGWGAATTRAVEVLLDGSAPPNLTWGNDWEDVRRKTFKSITTLILCAVGFFFYRTHQRQKFTQIIRDIGLSHTTKSNLRMFFIAFSGWYVSHFIGAIIAGEFYNILPRYKISATTVPPENTLPFFLHAIQAGPTEEIALVPLFLLLIPSVFPPKYRKVGVGVAITLAVAARVSFHLYYGPTAFVQHSIWAIGVITTWYFARNVWGIMLAHSCNNGLIALATDPSLSWLLEAQFYIFIGCLLLLALILTLNINVIITRIKQLRFTHYPSKF